MAVETPSVKRIDINKKSKFVTCYLIAPAKLVSKQTIQKEWVEPLVIDNSIYLDKLHQLKGIFEPDALIKFKSLFENNPRKLNNELMNLLLKVQLDKRKISIETIIEKYEFSSNTKLKNCLGLLNNEKFINIVKEADTSDLWSFFIERGKYPSVFEEYLIRTNNHKLLQSLLYLKQCVKENYLPLKEACFLYSLWIYKKYQIELLKTWLNLQ